MTAACILCSAGWVVGVAAILLLEAAPARISVWTWGGLVFVAALGFGACAAEDRVCEAAERQVQP